MAQPDTAAHDGGASVGDRAVHYNDSIEPAGFTLQAVLDLVDSCGRAYELSEPKVRRDYNQAFFTGIFLDVEDDQLGPTVAKVRRTPVLAALQVHRAPDGLMDAIDQELEKRQGALP